MNRKHPKLRLLLAFALSVLFVGAAAPVAHATAFTDVITGVKLTSAVGFQDGTWLNQEIDYCIPVGVKTGDTFTLTFPEQVWLGMRPNIYFPMGGLFASGHVADGYRTGDVAPYTYRMVFTDNAAANPGACSSDTEVGQLSPGLAQNNQPTPLTLVYSEGATQFPVDITVMPTAAQPFSITVVDAAGHAGATPATASDLGTETVAQMEITVTNTGTKPLEELYVTQLSLTDSTRGWFVGNGTFVGGARDGTSYDRVARDQVLPGESVVFNSWLDKIVPGTLIASEVTVTTQYPDVNYVTGQKFEGHALYYAFNEAPAAPVLGSAQVGGQVWNDANNDGVVDPSETGFAGVMMSIERSDYLPVTDASGVAVSGAVTDAQGHFVFNVSTLPANVFYQVYSTTPGGFSGDYGNSGQVTSYSDYSVSGTTDLGLNFGYYKPVYAVTITENDVNGDPADTAETAVGLGYEPGSTGLVFTITNTGTETLTQIDITDKVVRGGIVSDLTCVYPQRVAALFGDFRPASVGDGTSSSAGDVWYGQLFSGQQITCTANLTQVSADVTHHDDSTVTAVGYAPDESSVTVTATNPFFAKTLAAVTIGDTVWLDANKDGIQAPDELGIAGITLGVTGPDGKPVTDLGGVAVAPATTDAQGHYLFKNLAALPAGQHYTVTVLGAAGMTPTEGNVGKEVSVDLTTNGSSDLNLDFGFVPAVPAATPAPAETPSAAPPVSSINTGLPVLSSLAEANIAGGLGLVGFAIVAFIIVWAKRRQA